MNRYVLSALWMVQGLALAGARAERVDWTAWQSLPVFYNGRTMPLDTLARETVEAICGRQCPRVTVDGQTRRYQPAELVYYWSTDSARWNEVAFLPAEHESLRRLLELPLRDERGRRLRYATPAQVRQASAFWQRVDALTRHDHDDENAPRETPTAATELELDEKVQQLYKAYSSYRQLTWDAVVDPRARRRFRVACRQLDSSWQAAVERFRELPQFDADSRIQGQLLQVDRDVRLLGELARGEGELPTLDRAASQCLAGVQRLFDLTDDAAGGERIDVFASLQPVVAWASAAHSALYENEKLLRVIPALSAAALQQDRSTNDPPQPWLDLQTLVSAPRVIVKHYPRSEMSAVVDAFERLSAENPNDATAGRFERKLDAFAAALRALGEAVEPHRRRLAGPNRDDELLAYTMYPSIGQLSTELRYNRVAPFQWSWMLYLGAWVCLFVSGRRPGRMAVWCGGVLLVCGLAWSLYGFALRTAITGWAPVTNMYETVLFVPAFVAAMGLASWSAPLSVPAWRRAWRCTAWPWPWSACATSVADSTESQPEAVAFWNALLALPRLGLSLCAAYALCFAPYAAGGRAIVSLIPHWTGNSGFAVLNGSLAWLVGCVVAGLAVAYVPRVLLGLLLFPWMLCKAIRNVDPQFTQRAHERRIYLTSASGVAALAAFVAWYAPVLDRSFTPLQPLLRDNFWLTVHVLTIVSSYGAGALAWALGNVALVMFLVGRYPPSLASQSERRLPERCRALSTPIYQSIQLAVVLLAAGTILGGLWADVAWGRFWGWDPKEVWALITLLVYLAILHARYAGRVGHFGLAAGAVLGATAIMMSWYGVNFVLGVGLHSYGFGNGGQAEVLAAVLLNWLLVGAAAARYRWNNRSIATKNTQPPRAPAFLRSSTQAVSRFAERDD